MASQNFRISIYAFAAFATGLLCYRITKTENLTYIFLGWNLFLAFIPYWISSYLRRSQQLRLLHLPLLFAWLLFLPNSPYIVTDLFHFKQRPGIPLWYDLILVCSFALIGLALLYRSILDILYLAKQSLKTVRVNYILPFLFLLIAFGLYLGRYLRFNSWDVASHPFRLARSSFRSLVSWEAISFSVVFAAFMWLLYQTLVNFNKEEKQ
jgi:uncharacterized membrane protein